MSHGQANAEICTDVPPVLTCNHEQPIIYPINTQIALRHEALGRNTGFGIADDGAPGYTLQAGHSHGVAIGWSEELTAHTECAGTMQRGGEGGRHERVMTPAMQVRRLTPLECERLQRFPDGYTDIPGASDTARYKALGNSMACNVMALLGERINEIGQLDDHD
jgi:DNA (cytosine-5)-methyltransferase 1